MYSQNYGFKGPYKQAVILLAVVAAAFLMIFLNEAVYAQTSPDDSFGGSIDYELFYNHGSIMMILDAENGRIVDVNRAAVVFYGYSKEELLNMKISEINTLSEADVANEMAKAELEERNSFHFIHRIKNGQERNVEVYSYPFSNEKGRFLYSIIYDITDRIEAEKAHKRAVDTRMIISSLLLMVLALIAFLLFGALRKARKREKEVSYLHYHDQLTGIFNRRYMEMKLEELDSEEFLPLSVIMADVNCLKLANDAFGHTMGDRLLRATTDVFRQVFRERDILTRIGGDEFLILLPNTSKASVETLIEAFNERVSEVDIEPLELSVALGYATRQSEEENMDWIYKKAEDRMYHQKLKKSPANRNEIIHHLFGFVEMNLPDVDRHQKAVGALAADMIQVLGLSISEGKQLVRAALCHDVGLAAIDPGLPKLERVLTEDEEEEIHRHSECGYRILNAMSDYSEIADIILAHHERWDGTGYPKKLKESEIPYLARVLSVLDAYDAMTHYRASKPIYDLKGAVEELKACSGTQFDPEIVERFVRYLILG